MTGSTAFKNWLGALVACAALVAATMAWVDRPAADYVTAHFIFTPFSAAIVHTLEALELVFGVLLVIQLAAGVQALRGQRLGAWAKLPMLCSWSTMFTVVVVEAMKRAVGRSEVYPVWVHEHVHRFKWLHGTSSDYKAFPSGTTAVASAVCAVLWLRAPRLRWPATIGVVLIAIALVLTNSHWTSDTIAGAFVGWTIGWMTVALIDRSNPEGISR